MATYYNMEYEREEEIDGWQLDLADDNGEVIALDSDHYLMVDKPGGIKEASMWIPETYKRFYKLFFGKLKEMDNCNVMQYYYMIESVVEHLGCGADSDYLKSTAGNVGRSFQDLHNLMAITLEYCRRHKKNEPIIRIVKAKKTAVYNEHGVFCRWV